MKLLNSKSILDCSEEESMIHQKEVEQILSLLNSYENYDCAVLKKYQDIAHKDNDMEILSCQLNTIIELISSFDIKNGVDVLKDEEGYYVFVLYGQTYYYQNDFEISTIALKLMPYDNNRNFINLFKLN